MENNALILSAATFVAIITLYFAISSVLSARKKERDVIKRTAKWSQSGQEAHYPDQDESASKLQNVMSGLRLKGKDAKKEDTSIYADTPLFYQRAGIYNRSSIRSYRILRFVLLLTPVLFLMASNLLYNRTINGVLILAAVAIGYIGYLLPVLYLRVAAHYRRKELNRTFPDAMDLMMVCVEAGMGIDSAIRRVSQEIHTTSPELGKEFKILSLELKTGRSRNSCLKNLAKRADLPDVENLVTLLIQAEKHGTGVTHALRVHAEEMRQRRYSRLEELAAKLPVKLTVPLIFFIFPAFFVVLTGPAAIQVLRVIIQG